MIIKSVLSIHTWCSYLWLEIFDEDAETVLEETGGVAVLADWLVFKAPAKVANTFKTLSAPPVPESIDSPLGYYTGVYKMLC